MGRISFQTTDRDRFSDRLLERAFVTGMEGIPWHGDIVVGKDGLHVDKPTHESGHFHVPWKSASHGEILLPTTSLRESHDPYQLELEVARGTLFRLQTYLNERLEGADIGDVLYEKYSLAKRRLMEALTGRENPEQAYQAAQDSITLTLDVIDELCLTDARQLIEQRKKSNDQLATLLGARLDKLPENDSAMDEISGAVNSIVVPFNWRECSPDAGKYQFFDVDRTLSWVHQQNVKVIGGPIIQLDHNLPDWVYLWDNDFTTFQSYMKQYVAEVVTRYKGRVHAWISSAGLNFGGPMRFSEEQIVRLAVDVVEVIREIDTQTPVLITFDQPWGDYMATRQCDLAPIQFADALARAEIGINGIGIELKLGEHEQHSLPRDFLEISRLLNRWSMLQLPLVVSLQLPNESAAGENSLPGFHGIGLPPASDGNSIVEVESTTWSEQRIMQLMELIVAKPIVQAVLWNQLSDHDNPNHPQAGLLDANGNPKPVVNSMRSLRESHLG